ncbi:TraB/GumN family protein [Pseudoalteromonas sp. JBTF-M23]|uniref:TraB/GumN family protein n=1 Tax=Pseudoalteromonas caenipelagi TaxID=2726988 RepID=A0A849VCL9_9GAMM|nr:TraB/GumN family protein [Pseudoalteromonas caenipelagi]NOU51132.1 TraB/GumN family protein [Pseudoalteromonas caenipelagi]
MLSSLLRGCFISFVFTVLLFSQLVNANPALFQIEKNGIKSYLFGTVHVGTADMSQLPQDVLQAIKSSELVVVEVNLEALSPNQIQDISSSYMLLPNGSKLPNVVSPNNYQQLKSYFSKAGIDISHFHQHRPWAVMVTLLQLEYQKLGFSEQYGIDKQVLAYSKKHNKSIVGLETLQQQLTMLSSLEKQNNAMLEETFKHLSDIDFYFVDLVNAWKTGDMKKLSQYYKLSFDDSDYGKFSEQVMLINRNKQWLDTLSALLIKQPTFIAVGALHLPEQYGLVNLLQQAGFKVTKLNY